MPPRRLLTTLLPALALALGACGGSDDGDRGEGGSGGGFVAEADAICADASREAVRAYADSRGQGDEQAATIAYVTGLVAAREAELGELEGLTPPEADAADFESYLERRGSANDRLEVALDAAGEEDRVAFESASAEAEALRREADELGAGLGFGACAGRLSAEQEGAVVEVLEASATSADAELVCGLGTSRFQEQFGGLEGCIEAQTGSPAAKSIEVDELRGVDEVLANATVELEDRSGGLEAFTVNLTFEQGEWRIETIAPAGAS